MKKTLLTLLVSVAAYAQCQPYVLGAETQNLEEPITTKNSLVFKNLHGRWSVSSLKDRVDPKTLSCKDQTFVLANNNKISYKSASNEEKSYSIKRGWNALASYKDGVDIVNTFKNIRAIEFVYVYDKSTEAWAGYSPIKYNQDMMLNTRILSLKKIEPKRTFYVYSKYNVKVTVKSNAPTGICKTLLVDKNYASLIDSGIDSDMKYNTAKSVGVASRYVSHYRRGIYSESRITLIYPKVAVKKELEFKYGPAVPKSMLEYAPEFQDLHFYMFDHKDNKCYEGTFPSIKTPPFASLKELK